MTELLLGQAVEYPEEYAPDVLHAIARSDARATLDLGEPLPFHGVDTWNAWELTWLDSDGRPVVATATITVDAASPKMIESKSLKLYLGSFCMSRFDTATDVEKLIAGDIAAVSGAPVAVTVHTGPDPVMARVVSLPGRCIDELPLRHCPDAVDARLLTVSANVPESGELHSHLLRSLCPVTGQPDFGSVLVRYDGAAIDPASLLAYVVSFRRHEDFHEACVERMFTDIQRQCQTAKLTVSARYNRRGGIDINPHRSDFIDAVVNGRLWRQ